MKPPDRHREIEDFFAHAFDDLTDPERTEYTIHCLVYCAKRLDELVRAFHIVEQTTLSLENPADKVWQIRQICRAVLHGDVIPTEE